MEYVGFGGNSLREVRKSAWRALNSQLKGEGGPPWCIRYLCARSRDFINIIRCISARHTACLWHALLHIHSYLLISLLKWFQRKHSFPWGPAHSLHILNDHGPAGKQPAPSVFPLAWNMRGLEPMTIWNDAALGDNNNNMAWRVIWETDYWVDTSEKILSVSALGTCTWQLYASCLPSPYQTAVSTQPTNLNMLTNFLISRFPQVLRVYLLVVN